jgi:hypothetical protein
MDREVTLPSNIPINANDRPHRIRNATIVKKRDTLLMCCPIHVHVLLFHRQQRQHPITKEALRQSKQPRHVLIMDRLVILPIDAPTCINYQPQPKATRIWHELRFTRSATTVDKRVTLLMSVPTNDTALMWQQKPRQLPTAWSTLPCLLSNNNSSKGPIQPKNKAMQLCNARCSSTPAIFRLLLLGTRTCRCRRQLQTPRRIQLSGDVSTMKKKDHYAHVCPKLRSHPNQMPSTNPSPNRGANSVFITTRQNLARGRVNQVAI